MIGNGVRNGVLPRCGWRNCCYSCYFQFLYQLYHLGDDAAVSECCGNGVFVLVLRYLRGAVVGGGHGSVYLGKEVEETMCTAVLSVPGRKRGKYLNIP